MNKHLSIQELVTHFIREKSLFSADIEGCNKDEIRDICESQDFFDLPVDYVYFLTICGKRLGDYNDELELNYNILANYKTFFLRIVSEDWPDAELPEKFFVFSDHLGYAFSCFVGAESGVTVRSYVIGDYVVVNEFESFTHWLSIYMAGLR
ncbi:hypothetical protein [Deinococcus arcticus]|uniref:hypothetical protein n=1 Tax=Deinococcus arcticus TaxID=2136176 RepID=UPI0011B1F84A|nr:hypothetical protein [Deinococcus arcticus]